MTELTAGSLFSGIGGLDLAAAMAGFDILFHVELDDWRRQVLAKNAPRWWPHARQYKDITTLETAALPRPDVLFGGFPCQDVSLAGKRAGLGEGTRSGLWSEFRRLIGDLRPRAVVVENTPGLLSLGGSAVVGDLAALGYVGRAGIISAADAGAPHLRDRVFIVAYAVENRQPGTSAQAGEHTHHQNGRDPAYWPEHNQSRDHIANSVIPGGAVRGSAAVADPDSARCQRLSHEQAGAGTVFQWRYAHGRAAEVGRADADEPGLGGTVDGLSHRLDFPGYPAYQNQAQHAYEPPRVIPPRTSPDRTKRVEALGDAVVPWQAYPIFYYLREVLS